MKQEARLNGKCAPKMKTTDISAAITTPENLGKAMDRDSTLSILGCVLATVTALAVIPAAADESDAELAKQTLNPVASLISLPLKIDYNSNLGPTEQGNQSVLTVQD